MANEWASAAAETAVIGGGRSCRRVTDPCKPVQAGDVDGNWWQASCSGHFSEATKNLPLSPRWQPRHSAPHSLFHLLPARPFWHVSFCSSTETLHCEVTANHHTGQPFPGTCLQAPSAAPHITERTLTEHECPAAQSWCPGDTVPRWHSLPTDPAWAQATRSFHWSTSLPQCSHCCFQPVLFKLNFWSSLTSLTAESWWV